MKQFRLTTKALSLLLVIAFGITSCNTETEDLDESQVDYTEVMRSSEIDRASDSLDDISLKVFEIQEESENTRTIADYQLPECVTVTVVMQQNYREITIDFGEEGCLIQENLYQGQILLTYTRNPEAQEILITKTLSDFYFNGKNIVGGKTILRELSNDNGNPQFTKTTDITVIWPNGTQASREGQKIREWIEGFGTGNWSDNVFEVSGYWSTTFINGNTHSYTVDTPVRREAVCYYFVSGTIDVVRTNFSGVFDYGSGECDNMAMFTFANGTTVDVVLN
jgi:hypothetical protein